MSNWRKLATAECRAGEDHSSDGSLFRNLVPQGAELVQVSFVLRRWTGAAYFARMLQTLAIIKDKTAYQGPAQRRRFCSASLQPVSGPPPPAP